MKDKLVERTEPTTFEEICDYIDTTNIPALDKHELKSMIADCLQAERNKAIYDFEKALCMNETIDKSVVRRVSIQLQKGGTE